MRIICLRRVEAGLVWSCQGGYSVLAHGEDLQIDGEALRSKTSWGRGR